MNNNGLTQTDIKTYSELLIKANTSQLIAMQRQLQNELLKRT